MDEPTPSYDHEEASVSLKVVLLLFAVVLVGALAYLVMNQRNATDETDSAASTMIVKKKSPTVTATQTAIATSTADWKTYSSVEHGFTFKYPGDLKVTEGSDGAFSNIISVTGFSTHIIRPMTMTLDEYIARLKVARSAIGDQKISLDGVSAYEGIGQGSLKNSYGVYAVKNNVLYTLVFDSGNNTDTIAASKAALSATQKNMLASFKFIK